MLGVYLLDSSEPLVHLISKGKSTSSMGAAMKNREKGKSRRQEEAEDDDGEDSSLLLLHLLLFPRKQRRRGEKPLMLDFLAHAVVIGTGNCVCVHEMWSRHMLKLFPSRPYNINTSTHMHVYCDYYHTILLSSLVVLWVSTLA